MVFAAQLHRRQTRKGSNVPYVSHLLSVAGLVLEHGGDEDEAIAALLHDAVEDQGGKETLREIADRTGGRYFHAADADTLSDVIEEIDRLERSEITEVRYLEYEHHYASFVVLAIAFMAASAVLSGTWLRRLP